MGKNITEKLLSYWLEILVDMDVLSPGIEEFFLKDSYRNVTHQKVLEAVNSEIGDNITAYGIESSERGFKAGVDISLWLMGKEPIFGFLQDLLKGE